LIDGANFHAIQAHRRAGGKAGNIGEIGFEAVFGAEDVGAGNVKDADRQDQQADKDKQTHAQFRPRQLFALRHAEAPPCLCASLLHRTSAAMADFFSCCTGGGNSAMS